eukprot:s5560_g4.t1
MSSEKTSPGYPHVQYFSSFADLILDLKEANLPAISAGMQLHSRKNLQAAARFWRVSSCGSSWAFAATAVASFRECLVKLHGGEVPASLSFLSAQDLVSCSAHHGCSGGSAAEAFYYMKQHGAARETCSPYRMRCFHDQSTISMEAADFKTAVAHTQSSEYATMETAACKCLPNVFHLSETVACDLLPAACPKTRIPSYFKIRGTMEGNTDFFDQTSWSESGIYEHRRGDPLGRHGAALIGWGTDMDSRDYWLLLNSFGMQWRQGGYFKILRGDTPEQLLHYGAWGADFQSTEDEEKRAPAIFAVEVSFSPVPLRHGIASEPLTELAHARAQVQGDAKVLRACQMDLKQRRSMSRFGCVLRPWPQMWFVCPLHRTKIHAPNRSRRLSLFLSVALLTSAHQFATDERAKALVRVLGLASGMTAEVSEKFTPANTVELGEIEGGETHTVQIDLMKHSLLGDRLELRVWASDQADNTGSWGPVAFDVPDLHVFRKSLSDVDYSRRLEDEAAHMPSGAADSQKGKDQKLRWEVETLHFHI